MRRSELNTVIELLEEAYKKLQESGRGMIYQMEIAGGLDIIREAIALLKAPRWETPEQYEKRTGKKWPDDGPVWFRHTCKNYRGEPDFIAWFLKVYKDARDDYDFWLPDYKQIVCATEAGSPPKKWKPEQGA